MAKQTYDNVDENEMLALVSGGQRPYLPPDDEVLEKPEKAKIPEGGLTEIQTEPEVKPSKEKVEKVVKKRRVAEGPGEKDYDLIFLARTPGAQRCQTYIDRDTYLLIKSFLPVIAPGVSVAAYINNILSDHLDEHWDDINERYNTAVAKPLARR